MKTTNSPSEFKATLLKTTRVIFQSDELRVEARRVNNGDRRRSFQLRYYHLVEDIWQDFSTFASNTVVDCLNDIDYQFKIFRIV